MIAAVIRWSARNLFLIGFATIFVTLAGLYCGISRTDSTRFQTSLMFRSSSTPNIPARRPRWSRTRSLIR